MTAMTTIQTSTGQYQIRAIRYTVPSASTPGVSYIVSVDPSTQVMDCSCPARRECWHKKSVRTGMAGKPHVTARIMPPAPRRATFNDLYDAD
jgi:hypothetical protein